MEGLLVFYNKHHCTAAQIKSLKAAFQPGFETKKTQKNPAG